VLIAPRWAESLYTATIEKHSNSLRTAAVSQESKRKELRSTVTRRMYACTYIQTYSTYVHTYVHTNIHIYIHTHMKVHPHTTSGVGHYMHAEQGST